MPVAGKVTFRVMEFYVFFAFSRNNAKPGFVKNVKMGIK